MATMTIATLEAEKSEEKFEEFYELIKEKAQEIKIESPKLPRQRERPSRLKAALEPLPIYETVEEMYKAFYDISMETIISKVNSRFQQKGYKMVMNLENLLLKCALGQDYLEEFESVTNFYGSDLNKDDLKTQLLTFKIQFKEKKVELKDIIEVMKKPNTLICYQKLLRL